MGFPPINSPPCALVPATILVFFSGSFTLLFLLPPLNMSVPGPILSPYSPHLPWPSSCTHANNYQFLPQSRLLPPAPSSLPTSTRRLHLGVSVAARAQDSQLALPLLLCPPGQEGTPSHEPNHWYHPWPPATNLSRFFLPNSSRIYSLLSKPVTTQPVVTGNSHYLD